MEHEAKRQPTYEEVDPRKGEDNYQLSYFDQRMIDLNHKRTYDAYQDVDLIRARNDARHADVYAHYAGLALKSAVENQDMMAKQSIQHRDLAVDQHWNLEPTEAAGEAVVLRTVTIDDASLKAIGAAVAEAVNFGLAEALSGLKSNL